MPIPLLAVDHLQRYFTQVVERAEHHAEDVSEVLPMLAGVLIMCKDPGTNLEAHNYRGVAANALHVTIGGQRFALSYDHDQHAIAVKEGSFRGPLLAMFDNSTSLEGIYRVLRPSRRRREYRAGRTAA